MPPCLFVLPVNKLPDSVTFKEYGCSLKFGVKTQNTFIPAAAFLSEP